MKMCKHKKVTYVKACPICDELFTTPVHNQIYCKNCRTNRHTDIEKYRSGNFIKKRNPNEELKKMVSEVEKYNREHGTCLSYGVYVSLKSLGRI